MVCELVVGAMGLGSMHLAWACLTRGWVPMAAMGILAAVFCAALMGVTRGLIFAAVGVVTCLGVGVWMLRTVKPRDVKATTKPQAEVLAAMEAPRTA